VHVTWRQMTEQITDRPPFRPLPAALLMTMFLFTASVAIFKGRGLALILVTFTSILTLSWLANQFLRLLLPRLSERSAIAAVLVAGITIGFCSAGAISLVMRGDPISVVLLWAGGIFTSVFTLLIASVSAVLRQQRASEQVLLERTQQLRRQVTRMRQAQWLQQKALSRALHGPIQSAVTSAALRLDSAVRSGVPTAHLVEDIRTELRSSIDVLEVAENIASSLDTAFTRIIGTWEGICAVTLQIPDTAASHIEGDPLAAATVVDIVTEAVSNAVRHGGASQVVVFIDLDNEGIVNLSITDNGSPKVTTSETSGLGTTVLKECTLSWSRTTTETGHVLTASIPTERLPARV